MNPQAHKTLQSKKVLKRLLGQLVVVSLALSLVTACSRAVKKDCKLLFEAKVMFKTDYSDLTPEAQAM